jgi:calcineurin-like phosphoesterase family protein
MKTFVTSDLHFSHKNIINFCPQTRGHFSDIDQMNEWMIAEWNRKVDAGDLVYLLGDIAFCNGYDASKYVNRLNGRKILVQGNHDVKTLKDIHFKNAFEEVHHYLEVNYTGSKFVMCHYPIFDHNGATRGSIMLHGHRHGNPTGIPGCIMDVGYDSTGYIVTELDHIITKMSKVAHMDHH